MKHKSTPHKSVWIVPVFLLFLALFSVTAFAEDNVIRILNADGTVKSEVTHADPREAWNIAYRAAEAGDKKAEIVFGCNWTHDLDLGLAAGQDLTLDLNGHTILRTRGGKQIDNGFIFHIFDGTRLTVRDSDPASAGYDGIKGGVIAGGACKNGGGCIQIEAGGTCVIEGGTIHQCTTNDHGGAVKLAGASGKTTTLLMTGGAVNNCQTVYARANTHGGAVYSDYGTVYIENAQMDSCFAEDNGGAVYMNSGNLYIKNSVFSGNRCRDFGGAVFIDGGGLRLENCIFASNSAEDDGGAVYIDHGKGNDIRGCSFSGNRADGNGGAICVNDERAFLLDTQITENTAGGYGGGVYVDSLCDINLKGLMRICGNAGKNNRNNLTLQSGSASTAYLSSGGLTDGSLVSLSSTAGGAVRLGQDISAYQQSRYFRADYGSLELRDTEERDASMLASMIGSGKGLVCIGLGAAAVGTVIVLGVRHKKKANRKEDGE